MFLQTKVTKASSILYLIYIRISDCSTNCKSCSSMELCNTCVDGYFLELGACVGRRLFIQGVFIQGAYSVIVYSIYFFFNY